MGNVYKSLVLAGKGQSLTKDTVILNNPARKLSQFETNRTNRLVSVSFLRYVINPYRLGCRFPRL